MTGALRIVQRNALVYSRLWHGSVFMSFVQPTLFLLSIGLGLGALVDRGAVPLPGGVEYLDFLAPGLLAAAAMQTASYESSFPILNKIVLQRNYEAICATPIGIPDLVFGELAWSAVRQALVAVAFLGVLSVFDIPRSPLALLAVPAAVLTGLAFSAAIMAYAATPGNSNKFNPMFRFGITPLFLFSGVFFPIERLPEWSQRIAWITPLFHGVELTRGLTLNSLESPAWGVHLAYLLALTAAGALAAVLTFRRRLSL
jgi:lipooligosaccharide transport system permease protein